MIRSMPRSAVAQEHASVDQEHASVDQEHALVASQPKPLLPRNLNPCCLAT